MNQLTATTGRHTFSMHTRADTQACPGPDIHYLSACISYGMKDFYSAEQSIRAALEHLPDDEEMLALYAEILWVQNKHDEARNALEQRLTANRANYLILTLTNRFKDMHTSTSA